MAKAGKSKSSSKRTRKTRARKTKKHPRVGAIRQRVGFVARHLLLLGLLTVLAYWLWLDRQVAETFETRRWALPARVFARPVELYVGAPLSSERLVRELSYLGYRKSARPRGSGEYAVGNQRVEFHSRGFAFWDFPEPQRRVQANFDGANIQSLRDLDGAEAPDLMRLEPAEIGTINPRRFEDRKLLAYADLPPQFVRTLIAVEDRRFNKHVGIDVVGLARAMAANLRAGRIAQGGSTLTQQLVKNFYLTHERTLSRKLTEMMMAVSLELRYAKEPILETYVNEVFLGQDGNRAIHGFGLASLFYFGVPLAELDTASMATLVGMIKGPSLYDPRRNPDKVRQRRNVVLGIMLREKLISQREFDALEQTPVKLRTRGSYAAAIDPAWIDLVHRQLARDYSADDLRSAGLNIFTTLDAVLQEHAVAALRDTLTTIEQTRSKARALDGAAIVIDPMSGEILALAGGRNPDLAGFNRALDARRPIGSVIKPFIYAKALSMPERYHLATALNDEALRWTDSQGNVWEPKNFSGTENGVVSLIDALTRSLNLATVRLGFDLGITEVRDALQAYGLGDDIPAYPSLLLGTLELTPIELAGAYTAVANDGLRVPLRAIFDVTDQHGRKLNRYGLKMTRTMSRATAALTRHAMQRVVSHGTARSLLTDFPHQQPLAGKTGTSNEHRDSWFVGFGANRLAVTWVGRDDNGDTGLTGSSGALRVWSAIMAGANIRPISARLPAELSWQYVDTRRAVRVDEQCDSGVRLPVHEASALAYSESCSISGPPADPAGPVDDAAAAGGFFDRLRGLFD